MKVKLNWDTFGIATSIVCAIHCALLPAIAGSLPVFGINIIHNLFFEWAMIAIAFLVGIYSLIHGYTRHHKSSMPLLIFFVGMLLLLLKQVFHEMEFLFLALAVIFIITAHYCNYALCHKSKCTSTHHKH